MEVTGLARSAAIALLMISLSTTIAVAQAPADRAETAYQEGRRHYDLREWDQAIAKFKEAYRLRSDAASLFNIAQAYRLKGDCIEAVSFYKTYRRNFPTEKAVEKADKFIAELDTCAMQQAATQKSEPTSAEPLRPDPATTQPTTTAPATTSAAIPDPVPVTTQMTPVDQPVRAGGTLKIAGLVTAGVGVVAIGAGVAFGLKAKGKAEDLDAADQWDQGVYASGKTADRNAKIFLAVGGAATVGGIVMFYLGLKAGNESSQVTVAPTSGGASMVWSCAF